MSAGDVLLLVIAHPDDEHLCGAGTLALRAASGTAVHVVCATRGEYGPISDSALATPETLAAVRERELRASCAQLGVHSVTFLDLPDAGVDWAAVEQGSLAVLVRMLRELRPRSVITFGEDGVYGHNDHVAVHELVREARRAAGDPGIHGTSAAAAEQAQPAPRMFFPVWTEAHVRQLLAAHAAAGRATSLWGIEPKHFTGRASSITAQVDVTPVLERKLRALRCHRTQLQPDNALGQATGTLAARWLGTEYFSCADGQPGEP